MNHAELLTEACAEIVAACATVSGAVECIRDKPVDVAVGDYVLADGNSEPLQTVLKQRHIPFVVMTRDLLCDRLEAACKLAA
jgi:hypothetical protein